MNFKYSIYSKFKRGQILIILAVSLTILIGFSGLAIDSGRAYGVRAKLSSAVDAAAIAAARALAVGASDAEREASAKQAARDFYAANFPDNYLGATRQALGAGDITAIHDPQKGEWTVSVKGAAIMPVSLLSALNITGPTVAATTSSIRRDLDLILVLDSSGSLGSSFDALKTAAKNFVGQFNAGYDRVGLVSFASGAVNDVAINTSARGFDKTNIQTKITALGNAAGSTASAEGMRLALNQINSVQTAVRSSLRVIVFFSDGAPNDVPAIFNNGVTSVTGDLYSETSGPATTRATNVYRFDLRNTLLGNYSNIVNLPKVGFELTDQLNPIPNSKIPLASYNNMRLLDPALPLPSPPLTPYINTRCNVNKAARNMVENVANTARGQNIQIFTIALGSAVNTQEITFCGYGANERGSSILKRLANSNSPLSDTYNSAQPTGTYINAPTAADLEAAFNSIARKMIRLTQYSPPPPPLP